MATTYGISGPSGRKRDLSWYRRVYEDLIRAGRFEDAAEVRKEIVNAGLRGDWGLAWEPIEAAAFLSPPPARTATPNTNTTSGTAMRLFTGGFVAALEESRQRSASFDELRRRGNVPPPRRPVEPVEPSSKSRRLVLSDIPGPKR